MRWDGARQPVVWTVPVPTIQPQQARLEIARRYLHIFGPTTSESFAKWARIRPPEARAAFNTLASSLTPVHTPLGDGWILAADEPTFRTPSPPAAARLLPSGDSYYLLWGADRKLLFPDAKNRAALWTTRVWPGAVFLNGEIAGVWRRSSADVSIEAWRRFSSVERAAVEAEALSLPLPALNGPITVSWN